jgi:hypothetical protein
MPTSPAPIAKSPFGVIASAPLLWDPLGGRAPGIGLHCGVITNDKVHLPPLMRDLSPGNSLSGGQVSLGASSAIHIACVQSLGW